MARSRWRRGTLSGDNVKMNWDRNTRVEQQTNRNRPSQYSRGTKLWMMFHWRRHDGVNSNPNEQIFRQNNSNRRSLVCPYSQQMTALPLALSSSNVSVETSAMRRTKNSQNGRIDNTNMDGRASRSGPPGLCLFEQRICKLNVDFLQNQEHPPIPP